MGPALRDRIIDIHGLDTPPAQQVELALALHKGRLVPRVGPALGIEGLPPGAAGIDVQTKEERSEEQQAREGHGGTDGD